MDAYFSTRDFVDAQVKIIKDPYTLDEVRPSVDMHSSYETVGDRSLNKILTSVNRRKKAHFAKIFTREAIDHVVLQAHAAEDAATSSAKAKVKKGAKKYSNPQLANFAQSFNQSLMGAMSDEELVQLCEAYVKSRSDKDGSIKKELKAYKQSKENLDKYEEIERLVETNFGSTPKETIQPNLVTPQGEILEEVAKIRTLCAKMQAKLK
ncbi:hypothetical protein TRVA0_011S02300 [Trichomonascus vanleenenianus]|uniref:uncharacterized protein n=1 Tax=Trichomonascus vanleenenianus TaxID=2268995 RepID=UPI003ECAE49F